MTVAVIMQIRIQEMYGLNLGTVIGHPNVDVLFINL
jgi:hypothetical protein